MSYADQVFIQNIRDILDHGVSDEGLPVRPRWEDGTPAHTISLFGVVNRYDLSREFPLLTLRRTYWRSAWDEISWIWQKKSNNIRDLHSHVWDQWADEKGSIGKAYGYQYGVKYRVGDSSNAPMVQNLRDLFGSGSVLTLADGAGDVQEQGKGYHAVLASGKIWMDQVDEVIYNLNYNRANRRMIATAWNKADSADMALEPCAYSMTFNVKGNKLNAILNQRSQDMIVANAWNACQYSMILLAMASAYGYQPGELVHVIADCHIYDRHIPLAKEIIANKSYPVPKLWVDPSVKSFYDFQRDSFRLEGEYQFSTFDQKIPVAI